MKWKNLAVCLLSVSLLATIACSRKTVIVKSSSGKSLPPGQAKKLTGSKSAAPYAPGQRKKKH